MRVLSLQLQQDGKQLALIASRTELQGGFDEGGDNFPDLYVGYFYTSVPRRLIATLFTPSGSEGRILTRVTKFSSKYCGSSAARSCLIWSSRSCTTPPRLFSATRSRAASRLAGSLRLCSAVLLQVQRLHLRVSPAGGCQRRTRRSLVTRSAGGLASRTTEPGSARKTPRGASLLCTGCTARARCSRRRRQGFRASSRP